MKWPRVSLPPRAVIGKEGHCAKCLSLVMEAQGSCP
jgi:hypothetical protein